MIISCNNLSYRYSKKAKPIFTGFNFTAKPGVTLLNGFSGCGKSTLLRLIASLLKPNSGTIETPSKHRYGSNKYLRQDIGFLFQQFNLLPLASIKRNITIASQLSGNRTTDTNYWLETFGLEQLSGKKPTQLSGGQLQRAALARTLAKRSPILLLDEPTSGLDDLNTDLIKTILTEQLDSNTICIIATHDQRLNGIANEIHDFNSNLPVEKHIKEMVRKSNFAPQ